ncbi:Hydroxyindole-O-methyltransferase [Handroanthus impetiginosus]|uniref:Hydroxyindole-O-methyltransferase n=1 Tax=Handroanthus impetiginosus TaxID=429701 RepID=A0A2G9I924_9LAMI|nr:Hydroxyindole-O-methyltransferase [Handroanthus impetiginosus]
MASLNGVGHSTQELLDAQAHVWNHIFNFINFMSLKCAVQLGIPDIIQKHGKPMMLSQLVDALPINKAKACFVYRLMHILIHSKFFVNVKISDNDNENEGYWLTPASHLLLKDKRMSMVPFALAMLDPILIDPLHHVSEWFQNESPSPFVAKHGMSIWEYMGIEQKFNQLFNEAMASDAWFLSTIARKECKQLFEGLKSMVDVGGGTGMVAKAIANAFPGLQCTVLELPRVVVGLEGTENLTCIGGDMFDFIPPADAVFLKFFFDMLMMVNVVAKERTEEEWAKLFFAAGFTSYKINKLFGLRSVIEVFP